MPLSLPKIKKPSASSYVILGLLVFCLLLYRFFKVWKTNSPFESDCDQYYSYLVAFFIHNDLSFNFPNTYWLAEGPLGIPIQKMSLGVALLESPFFLIGHFIAKIGGFPTTGYSLPYAWSVNLGVLTYVMIGLNLLRKSLLKFYSQFATSLTLIGVFIGTNLFFYTVSTPTMGHSFLFFLFSALIYFTIIWHEQQKISHLYLGVLVAGFITVVRPNHAIALLIPILYNVTSWESLKSKIQLFLGLKIKLAIAFLIFMLPIIPQLLYWKIYSGSWIYFSYTKEGFFFNDPQILEVLFSYRKGWFIYTPIMLLAFVSMFFYKNKQLATSSWVYFVIGLYIISSWWCWWYGGSYGMRAMIDFYPLFAFPLAFFFDKFKSTIRLNIAGSVILSGFVYLSIIGTIQYKKIIIHWDSMSRASFWYGFNKISFSAQERKEFDALLDKPDYEGALVGERDITELIPQKVEKPKPIKYKNNVSYDDSLKKVLFAEDFEKHPKKIEDGINGSYCIELTKELKFTPKLIGSAADLGLNPEQEVLFHSGVRPHNKSSKMVMQFVVRRNNAIHSQKQFFWETGWLGQELWTGIEAKFITPPDLMGSDTIETYIEYLEGDEMFLDEMEIGLK